MAEDRVRRSWEPIPHGLPVDRGLGLQVVSELRERIPFCIPILSRYALVPAGEHNGLKNYAVDLIGVAESEAHDLSHAIIVETVDHGNLQGGLHSSRSDVLQRAELHFHVISKPAMFVLLLGDAIELQVHAVQPGGARLDSKISAFQNEYHWSKREDDGSPCSSRVELRQGRSERVWPRHRRTRH